MGVRINGLDRMKGAIDAFVRDVTLDDAALARDISSAYSEELKQRAAQKRGPDGSSWPENEERYRRWKEKYFGSTTVGVLTGQMLSERSLVGRAIVGKDRIRIVYGTGDESGGGSGGKGGVRSASDVEKMAWFQQGNARQRPRRLLGADDRMAERIALLVRRHLGRKLRERGLA